jgi:hypothetical protein
MSGSDGRRHTPSLAGFGLSDDAQAEQDKQEKQEKDARRDEARAKQKADAPRATAEYEAAQQANRDRTAALREARLAREAANPPDARKAADPQDE